MATPAVEVMLWIYFTSYAFLCCDDKFYFFFVTEWFQKKNCLRLKLNREWGMVKNTLSQLKVSCCSQKFCVVRCQSCMSLKRSATSIKEISSVPSSVCAFKPRWNESWILRQICHFPVLDGTKVNSLGTWQSNWNSLTKDSIYLSIYPCIYLFNLYSACSR